MKIVMYLMIYGYAAAMGTSSILLGVENELPIWLRFSNLLSAILLACTPVSKYFLYGGIIALFFCAILNGYYLNGHPNGTHVIVRLILSIAILYLYQKWGLPKH